MQLISFCNSWILPVWFKDSVSIFDQFSPWSCTECRALKSFQFFHLIETSHELHEVLDFVPIIVHEEVVDLVEVVRLFDEHDKFLFFETWWLHSTFGYFFCHNRLGIRAFESLLDNQRESALFCCSRRILICSFSESRRGFSRTFEISDPNSSETGLPVLTWPTDYDWLDNKLSSGEW